MFLRVALGYQPGLVSVDRAIGVVLDLVHPPPSDWFYTCRCINQVPGSVFRHCQFASSTTSA
jgi:hypothetical protein